MKRRVEIEIMKNWPKANTIPKVTVIAICYCHKKYLRTALDSILAQETNFPFEVLVHDDTSPDGSVAIIKEYAKAYPHIIRPILEHENQFSKGIKALLQAIKPGLKGKYFAYLDCDDYWTDAHKLQEQVDFLEGHPAYLAVAHNCTVVDVDGMATGEQYPECRDEEFTIDHFMNDTLAGQLSSLVVRDIFTQVISDHHLIINALQGPFDRVLNLTLLINGRVHCIQKSMSAYRHITSGGTSFSATYRFDIQREIKFYLSLVFYCKRMGRTGDAVGMQRWLVEFLERFVAGNVIDKKKAEPYLGVCRTSIESLSDKLRGCHKRCTCCGKYVVYEPLPIEKQEAALSVDRLFLPETLNPDDYLCPDCRSVDWERLMIATLERMELQNKGREYRVLQLAHSSVLNKWLNKHFPCVTYETLDTEEPDFQIYLQELSDIPDGRYDLILCANVLEYVRDDCEALRELKRILKKDGCVLLLASVDLGFSGIDEAWGLSKEENYLRFGQENHVRRYSHEGLLERLSGQFAVQFIGKDYFGDDCFWNAGLSDSSTLYVLSKPGHTVAFAEKKNTENNNNDARLVVYIQEPGDSCYTESKSVRTLLPLESHYSCTISLSELGEISHIRIDPMECPCFFQEINVSLMTVKGERIPVQILGTNGIAFSNGFLFNNDDPQIELAIPQGEYLEVSFSGELISSDRKEIEHLCNISTKLSQSEEELKRLSLELKHTTDSLAQVRESAENLKMELSSTKRDYEIISNSTFWKLTKPVRIIIDALKKLLHIC